jgi:hypothetical protein
MREDFRMSRLKTWEVSDKLWKLAEPLIPVKKRKTDKVYKRKAEEGVNWESILNEHTSSFSQ